MAGEFIKRAVMAALVAVTLAPPARAQTAYDVNRLNQAMQICNSPMGAGVPECAKLGSMTGGAATGFGGFGGKAGGIAAGLLGAAMSARQQQAPAAAAPMGPNPAMQAALTQCIQNAAGNTQVIQACLSMMNGGANMTSAPMAAPPQMAMQPNFPAGQQMLPSQANSQAAAMGSYAAAQTYQACVAANPTNWQMCVQQMQAASTQGLMGAGVSAAQIQAAGGQVPGMAARAAQAAPAIAGFLSHLPH